MSQADDILAQAAAWRAQGETVALATVIETWGSAPFPPGSQMALTATGRIAGSVSAGCVEGAVADAAQAVMRTGTPHVLAFGVTNERAWEVGLTCGGSIRVLVERLEPTPALRDVLAARSEHRPIVLATRLSDGAQRVLTDETTCAENRSRVEKTEGEDWFLHAHAPPVRVIAIGAVHIAQALARVLAPLGMAFTVLDPRRRFATEERFPGVDMQVEWPDAGLDALALDTSTAIVALSHDPKLDDPALDLALRSPAFYIGALGSRTNHARRLQRLAALGHAPGTLARIHGPIGLRLGALTPAEIALSIAAEIVAVRRNGDAVRA